MKKLEKIISILFIFILLSMSILPKFSYAEPENQTTKKYVVALDPGHGNNGDPGASYNGLKERVLIEKTVNYIKQYLEQNNMTVVIVGPWEGQNTSISLSQRYENAKNANADFILSVHYNAGGGQGAEVLWKSEKSKSIAANMSKSISESTGLKNRGAKHYQKDTGRSITLPSLGPENSTTPAVLIEGGFIDSSDRNVISTEEGLKNVAKGAVKTVMEYFNSPATFGDVNSYDGGSGSSQGMQSAGKGTTEVNSNEYKFLGLWKNSVGKYVPYYNEDGTINADAIYNKKGKVVDYKFFGSPVDTILSSADWLSHLLVSNERTQEHDKIMKYLMYIYTGKDYGVKEYDFSIFDIDTFTTSGVGGYGDGSVKWNNSITKEEFINICKNYVPSSASYQTGWNEVFLANIETFYDASVEANINPMFTVSVGVHESGFGTSKICKDKNNIFGYRAEDSDAYGLAWGFDSIAACVKHWTKWISGNYVYDQHYYDPNNQPASEKNDASYRYDMIVEKGKDPTTVEGIGSLYASDGSWAAKVKEHWINIFGDGQYPSGSSSSDVIQKAQECIDILNSRQVTYAYGGGAVPMTEKYKSIDCSHYVSWVLYECGYDFGYWTSYSFEKNTLNWEKITDKANLQPGDILVYDGHVDIYAGPGSDGSNINKVKKYNAGATNTIRQSPYESGWRQGYKFALRPSK